MSASVRKADKSDINAICHLLHTKMNPKISLERWHRLMSYRWLSNIPDYGRVVDLEGEVLGFCGMIYADRWIGEGSALRQERIVSMSSWYLDKSLRGQGFGRALLEASTNDSSMSYHTVSNSKKPIAIVEAHGYQKLETHRFIWQKNRMADSALTVVEAVDVIASQVSSLQRTILEDMQPYAVTPIVIEIEGESLLLFFSVKKKAEERLWYDLLYASNYELFTECSQQVADQLLPDSHAFLAADGRFVRANRRSGARHDLPVSRYFISNRVRPEEIDLLYSELQLLDLKLD